jgi:HAAS
MTDDELAAAYLRRLRRAARVLPRARRQELVDEIAEHIAQARASAAVPGKGEPEALRNALERLGEPRDIVAAAGGGGGGGVQTARPAGLEVAAVALLLTGGIVGLIIGIPGVIAGWGAGVLLLWVSPRWRWPDKLLGTLVWPGGFAAVVLLGSLAGSAQVCSGGSGTATRCSGSPGLPPWLAIPITVVAVAGPTLVAIRLLVRARRVQAPDESAAPQLIAS